MSNEDHESKHVVFKRNLLNSLDNAVYNNQWSEVDKQVTNGNIHDAVTNTIIALPTHREYNFRK